MVTKVEAVGALDVKFTLNRKFSPLLSNLAIPPGFVISMEALKKVGKGINENPVGTGPFKFVEWKKDDHITVEAFDGYWGNKPKLQRIVFQPVPEASVRALKIQNGEGDVAWPIDPKDVPRPEGPSRHGRPRAARPERQHGRVQPATCPSNQNKTLRQAMNYADQQAGDRRQAVQRRRGTPRTGVLPPTSWALSTPTSRAIRSIPTRPGSCSRTLATTADRSSSTRTRCRAATTRRAANWPRPSSSTGKTSASRPRSRPSEWTQYRADRRAGKLTSPSAAGRRTLGTPRTSWACSSTAPTRAASNTSFYGVPEVDQLLNQANEETDVAKRKDLFNQAEKRIVDDAPWLFIGHMKQQVAIRKRVQGFVHAADVHLLLQQRSLGVESAVSCQRARSLIADA